MEKYFDLKLLQAKGLIFVVVNININYRKPSSFGDILELSLELKRIGDKSAVFYQEIRMKETGIVVTDAEVTFVFADVNTGKAIPIDNEIKGLLDTPNQNKFFGKK